jgi:hypothetical protein
MAGAHQSLPLPLMLLLLPCCTAAAHALTCLSLEHAQRCLAQSLHVLLVLFTPCLLIVLTIISINIILWTGGAGAECNRDRG